MLHGPYSIYRNNEAINFVHGATLSQILQKKSVYKGVCTVQNGIVNFDHDSLKSTRATSVMFVD
jgi:hypothetical protein